MQMGVDGTASTSLAAGELAALLGWWNLAGADTPVTDVARPWLGLQPAAAIAAARTITASTATTEPPPPAADPQWAGFETLAALRAAVLKEVPNAPFADGNAESGVMLLGEAPSADDLASGRPFSGPAGRFLDRMLAAIHLDRTSCYISLLCPRRAVAGTPPPEAIAADLELTRAHIRLANPRLVVLLGAKPVRALTTETAPIGRIRGQWLAIDGDRPIPALATFNPAYLLRRPEEKTKAWADLLALQQRLG